MRLLLLTLALAVLSSASPAEEPAPGAPTAPRLSSSDLRAVKDALAAVVHRCPPAFPLGSKTEWKATSVPGRRPSVLLAGPGSASFRAAAVKDRGRWIITLLTFEKGFAPAPRPKPLPAGADSAAYARAARLFPFETKGQGLRPQRVLRYLSKAPKLDSLEPVVSTIFASGPQAANQAVGILTLTLRASDHAMVAYAYLPTDRIPHAAPALSRSGAAKAFKDQFGFVPAKWTFASAPITLPGSWYDSEVFWVASRGQTRVLLDRDTGKAQYRFVDFGAFPGPVMPLDAKGIADIRRNEYRMTSDEAAAAASVARLARESKADGSWQPIAAVIGGCAGAAVLLWLLVRPRISVESDD